MTGSRALRAMVAGPALSLLAACMPAPVLVPTLAPTLRPPEGAPAAPPAALPERLPRMTPWEFEAASAAIPGVWQVATRPDDGCRLTLEPVEGLGRDGRITRSAGCLDRRLFFARDWTMTAPDRLVLLDLMGDPLLTLSRDGAGSFSGEGITLRRAETAG